MQQTQLMITNIQRMCFHDGPGIRTTVFLKGCNLHCPWCSNPENLNSFIEYYENENINGRYGKLYETSELINILLKDKDYWSDNGGVTFSGGEPLTQASALVDTLKKLKEYFIHVAIETALFVSQDKLELVLPYVDYFIVDVKILDATICKKVIGGNLEQYKKNIDLLYQSGKLKLFRFPCCMEYTFTNKNQKLTLQFLKDYKDIPVELFSIHNLGEKKYVSLKRTMWKTQEVEKKVLFNYCKELEEYGLNASVIQI